MFSPTSPSPNRSMIKEANDHLQLLHHRVLELEKIVQEQAEALIKKDEAMQTRVREVSDAKDAKIKDLNRTVDAYEQRVKKLEQQCRDKDGQMEVLGQKCGFVEELSAYTPILERLVGSLKKLPRNSNSNVMVLQQHHQPQQYNAKSSSTVANPSSKSRNRTVVRSSSRMMDRAPTPGHNNGSGESTSMVDGHDSRVGGQAIADLRIGRSFSINQNFSMSEDEVEEYS